jgi:membrane protease YdiL (CAAX protease family)
VPALSRGRIWWEIAIVLGVSLGISALRSIVVIIDRSTRDVSLGDQSATLNPSLSDRAIFDLLYNLLTIAGWLIPVLLVGYLLWSPDKPHLRRLGFDGTKVGRDVLWGVGLVLVIGIPGLALYLGGRALGITVAVNPAGLDTYWWTIPVLLLSAIRAGLQEEVIVLGYLFARLGELGWNRWAIIAGSALFRASYHLYQGWGSFVGNFLMGLLFGWLYSRWKRVLPFVVAHALLDAAIFVGYPWVAAAWPELFGLPQ